MVSQLDVNDGICISNQYVLYSVLDIDECSADFSVCDVNAVCQNTFGSYICSCKAGFTGDGKNCTGKRKHNPSLVDTYYSQGVL